MTNQELSLLARKYLAGTATQEERNQLNEWYNTFNDPLEVSIESDKADPEKRMEQRLLSFLEEQKISGKPETGIKNFRRMAAALIVIMIGIGSYFFLIRMKKEDRVPEQSSKYVPSKAPDHVMTDGVYQSLLQEYERTKDVSTGVIPVDRLIQADEALKIARQNPNYGARVQALSWVERGSNSDAIGISNGNTRPGSNTVTSGRLRAIQIDISNPNRVWIGGVDGGMWRTDNITASPATWVLANDFFANLAVGAIAQNPANPDILYFGTGERSFNSDAVRGGGIWKSTDHGVTWNLLPSTTSFWNISRIVCDAAGNVYMGTIGNNSGVQRSTDGGNTWTNISPSGLSLRIAELEISSTGRLHIHCGYYNTAPASAGYRFTDNPATVTSATWTAATTPFTPVEFNVDIAVAGNTLYAIPANASFQTNQVWKSTDGGANWAITATTPPVTGSTPVSSGQAWYNLGIGVDPTNADNVMVGGLNSYRSTNGGATWTPNSVWLGGVPGSTNYIHADHHIIVWNNNMVLDGGDGGIFYSADDGATFADRNVGLRLKQFYACAIHPTTTNYFIGGTQDNGVHQFNNAGLSSSIEVTGGDGAFVHIDQDEPAYQWGSYVFNNYRRSVNGGVSWSSINFSDNGQFINPTDYDDIGNRMYASYLNNTYLRWENPQTGSTFTSVPLALLSGSVQTVMASPNTLNRVYFGSSSGRIIRVDNAHTNSPTVTNITQAGMSASTVSCVAIGTTDNNLLATFSNYGAEHVWLSTDGTTWTNVSGNIPDVPVRWAMFYPEDNTRAILATEMGIFETDLLNGASTVWVQSSSFPVVRTDMLQYRKSDGTVLAATHGRGMYSAVVPFSVPYVRFGIGGTVRAEGTTTTNGCRRYTDYTIPMNIDVAPTGAATVTLSIAGGATATQGADFDFTTNGNFAAPSNVITFPNGSTASQTFTLRVYDDGEIESTESLTFNYAISGATNALAAPSSIDYDVQITDNDVAPVPGATGNFNIGTYNANASLQVPFRSNRQKHRIQMLYTAAELNAAGIIGSSTISAMNIRVVIKNSTQPYNGLTISLANTAATTLSTGFVPGAAFTQVFSGNYASVVGNNTFNFASVFNWDGVSNVLVQFCYDNAPNPADAADDVMEATVAPLGAGIRATTYSDFVSGATAGCALNAAFISDARITATFAASFGNPVESTVSSTRSEFVSNNSTYYFFNGTNIISSISNASANLGCVGSTILETGNVWQSFAGGQRSQKVFDIAPATNPGSSYTIGLYFTAAELAGKTPSTLRIAKSTAATTAGINSGNTIAVTTNVTAFGTGYLFTATFTGFSKFFLVDAGVALPVDLISFSGYLNTQEHSELKWQTTNQYNLSVFEVQRSYDGSQFVTAGTVAPTQNPSLVQDYYFTDPLIAKPANFYRLKMVDQDGRFKYSAVIRINNNKPANFVQLLQNPVKDNINFLINNSRKDNVSVQLFGMSGQLVKRWELGKADGNVLLPLNNAIISKGIYSLRIAAGDKAESLKISVH